MRIHECDADISLPWNTGEECSCTLYSTRKFTYIFPPGLKTVPENIPDDATLLDLQNNKITEIKENDFKNLKGLHVRHVSPPHGLFLMLFRHVI